MEDRDTKGDLYEYMLGKIAAAGQNGQFRTPRHIIRLMVEMTAPGPKDIICDPACGTGGFLVAAGEADGWLDDKRTPLLSEDKLGPVPRTPLSQDEHARNNLPDVLARWTRRDGEERERPRTAQSFCVPKADLAAAGYDLSVNRYKEVVHAEVAHRPIQHLLADLEALGAAFRESWQS